MMIDSMNDIVMVLGIIILFVIAICMIVTSGSLSKIADSLKKEDSVRNTPHPVQVFDTPQAAPVATPGQDNQKIVAAIATAIAEDIGTDVSRLRIHSIRRI